MHINQNFLKLNEHYLFSRISRTVAEHQKRYPEQTIIRLGIGDVTRPLVPAVIEAMRQAVAEMGDSATFRGYGEEQGYGFLRETIASYYARKGVNLAVDEIFIGDGAKSDLGNILDLFSHDNTVLIPDPVYPAYVDTNQMDGRRIVYIQGSEDNQFLPMPDPRQPADLIYLCSPNNPTGAVYNAEQLKLWVDYALDQDAVILFDSAYEGFVRDDRLPTSLYQIEGASRCAIEFGSFSKTAGFTGTRCGYTIVPMPLRRDGASLNSLWLRRQSTKFNGVSYIVQRGAQAAFSDEGLRQIQENIDRYMDNARLITDTMTSIGIPYSGGKNAPYVWLKCPNGLSSWETFDHLLTRFGLVGTPGSGFGQNGEGYFRLSAFGERQQVESAMARLRRG